MIKWKPPKIDSNNNLKDLLGYCVEKRDCRKTTWQFLARTKNTYLELNSTQLDSNYDYIFRVASENKFGVGEALESEKFTIKKSG